MIGNRDTAELRLPLALGVEQECPGMIITRRPR